MFFFYTETLYTALVNGHGKCFCWQKLPALNDIWDIMLDIELLAECSISNLA